MSQPCRRLARILSLGWVVGGGWWRPAGDVAPLSLATSLATACDPLPRLPATRSLAQRGDTVAFRVGQSPTKGVSGDAFPLLLHRFQARIPPLSILIHRKLAQRVLCHARPAMLRSFFKSAGRSFAATGTTAADRRAARHLKTRPRQPASAQGIGNRTPGASL